MVCTFELFVSSRDVSRFCSLGHYVPVGDTCFVILLSLFIVVESRYSCFNTIQTGDTTRLRICKKKTFLFVYWLSDGMTVLVLMSEWPFSFQTLFNPNKTVVKVFVVMYNMADMPPNSTTFLRQRTLYLPNHFQKQQLGGQPSNSAEVLPSYLRYLIHLRLETIIDGW